MRKKDYYRSPVLYIFGQRLIDINTNKGTIKWKHSE